MYIKRFYKISNNPEYVTSWRCCFKFLKITALMSHEQVSESQLITEPVWRLFVLTREGRIVVFTYLL